MEEVERLRRIVKWLVWLLAVYVPMSIALIAFALVSIWRAEAEAIRFQHQVDARFYSIGMNPEEYSRQIRQFDSGLRRISEKLRAEQAKREAADK